MELASAVIFDGAARGRSWSSTAKEWRENYFSAVGPLLFMPRDWRTSMGGKARLRIVIHEATHTSQFWADARFVPWYVGHRSASGVRKAKRTAPATNSTSRPTGKSQRRSMHSCTRAREGYAMNDGDKRLVGGMRERHVTSVVNGVITSHWGSPRSNDSGSSLLRVSIRAQWRRFRRDHRGYSYEPAPSKWSRRHRRTRTARHHLRMDRRRHEQSGRGLARVSRAALARATPKRAAHRAFCTAGLRRSPPARFPSLLDEVRDALPCVRLAVGVAGDGGMAKWRALAK